MRILVYDCECKKSPVPTPEFPHMPTASGWGDYRGMGISCIGWFDVQAGTTGIIVEEPTLDPKNCGEQFVALASQYDAIAGYNNRSFDDKLIGAHALGWEHPRSLDLGRAIQKVGGGRMPKLADILACNGLPAKAGDSAMAPVYYYNGEYSKLYSHVIQDVLTEAMLVRLALAGRLKGPNGESLSALTDVTFWSKQ